MPTILPTLQSTDSLGQRCAGAGCFGRAAIFKEGSLQWLMTCQIFLPSLPIAWPSRTIC